MTQRIRISAQMVYDLGHKMTQTELVAATQILDKNNDGRISYKEFSVRKKERKQGEKIN